MATKEPASFLNLDLELEASTSLEPLHDHLKPRSHILFSGKSKNGYRLALEPVIRGRLSGNASACTKRFLAALEALPSPLAKLLRQCKTKVFDYGFDGGLESGPLAVTLSNEQLSRISRLGIEVRITVYPYRAASDV
jgi:hypothetical protein